MKITATAASLKERLNEYLGHVKAGSEVVVTEHGLPVARLTAIETAGRPANPSRAIDTCGPRREPVSGTRRAGHESSGSTCAGRIAEARARFRAAGVAHPSVGRTVRGSNTRGAARRPHGRRMMFWDSSAVVPLIVPSPQSTTLADHLAADRGLTVWRGTAVECAAALYRSHREESIGQAALDAALLRLHAFTEDADTVAPGGVRSPPGERAGGDPPPAGGRRVPARRGARVVRGASAGRALSFPR